MLAEELPVIQNFFEYLPRPVVDGKVQEDHLGLPASELFQSKVVVGRIENGDFVLPSVHYVSATFLITPASLYARYTPPPDVSLKTPAVPAGRSLVAGRPAFEVTPS